MSVDEAVIATNDSASNCKRFAVKLGYWSDPYIQYFVRSAERKPPEINRGYYTRTESVKLLVEKFIKVVKDQKYQIVNLGAGYDTLFWRLKDEGYLPESFIDVDFPPVTSYKCHCIKSRKPLLQRVASEDDDIRMSSSELHSNQYHIISADLRNVTELENKLVKECGLDKNLPTIFIAECVLIYIGVAESGKLLKWIADSFSDAVFINYEQVNMNDRFGEVMVNSLSQRQCILSGVEACQSLQTQMSRFTDQGWHAAVAQDMNTIYSKLPQGHIQRIESLEFMDEREIFEQLMRHYCITVAYKVSSPQLDLQSVVL